MLYIPAFLHITIAEGIQAGGQGHRWPLVDYRRARAERAWRTITFKTAKCPGIWSLRSCDRQGNPQGHEDKMQAPATLHNMIRP